MRITHSIDAPSEGWNAFDSLDNMPESAAVILNNLIPGAGDVETRKGHIVYEDLGTGEPVETLASYNPDNDSILIAASAGGIWELQDSVVEVATYASTEIAPPGTYANDRWQCENFQKADEQGIMAMCNGADPTQIYNGNTLVDITITPSDPPGDEPDPDFIGCVAFKGRMYYWHDNDNAFWYSQAGSYQGELQKFDLGSFVQQGGHIVTVFTWTQQDSGQGYDDFIVFAFSTGEILVYQGDDPQTAGYWEQVGRYRTAEPLGIRSQSQYGADALLMTKDGYVSMSSIIQEGRTSDVPAFSRLIHREVVKVTRNNSDMFGWDVQLYPRDGLLIFNVPLSDDTFVQHVMNTVTQRWCQFNSMNTTCLEVHGDRLFGGMRDGTVIAMLEGTADNGNPITFDCLYAFSYLGNPGKQKVLTGAQVLSTHSNPQEINISGWADFSIPNLTPINLLGALSQATWSVNPQGYVPPVAIPPPDQLPLPVPPSAQGSEWNEDYWSGQGAPYTTTGWQNVAAMGWAIALLVRFAKVNETVTWRSTTLGFHEIGAQ